LAARPSGSWYREDLLVVSVVATKGDLVAYGRGGWLELICSVVGDEAGRASGSWSGEDLEVGEHEWVAARIDDPVAIRRVGRIEVVG
jgi:hypothetical protein